MRHQLNGSIVSTIHRSQHPDYFVDLRSVEHECQYKK